MWDPKHFGPILGNVAPKLTSNKGISIVIEIRNKSGSGSNWGDMGGGDYGYHLDIGGNFQQVRAPKIWYDKLKGGIEVRGFKYLNPEPRIFIYNKVI